MNGWHEESQELEALPVFPLTGMLLLPGTYMPLNIFEQRYRNLVADVLDTDRLMGMVQPVVPAADNFGPPDESAITPDSYLIVLEGQCRFRVRDELPLHRGYRRVRALLLSEEHAVEDLGAVDGGSLRRAAVDYCRQQRIGIEPEVLAALPGWRLVNALAAALPFAPAEKQALLESPTLESRKDILMSLFEMSGVDVHGGESDRVLPPN